MPEGRMLKKVITTSQKLIALKSDSARLFYTWMIPFADCEGRLRANPYILKGMIFPYSHHSPRRIIDFLKDCHSVGLITLYENSNEKYLQIKEFHTHQSISRKADGSPKKESKSTIPPCPKELRNNSRLNPEQLQNNSTESKGKGSISKVNSKEGDEIDSEFEDFWKFYKSIGNSEDDIGDKQNAKKAYKILRRSVSKEEIAKATHGEADYLKYKRLRENFTQRKKFASTWLRSNQWKTHKDFKYEATL